MKKHFVLILSLILFSSHDMFLKMDTYYLQPNEEASIALYNGTFTASENTIDRNRMIDVSLVGNGLRTKADTTQWIEKDLKTILNFTTGEEGTWVAGVSTRARNIELEAKAFNDYLDHDGVIDMLDWRKQNDVMEEDAIEKYSKHVKTIFQVGEKTSSDWDAELGYPIEFVPLSNPYDARKGDQLKVKLLRDGNPLVKQLVYVGSEHAHSHDHDHDEASGDDHQHNDATKLTTDNNGVVTMELTEEGIYYLRTIHMTLSEEEGLTHESNWATLTFEVGHGHSHADGHSHGIGNYAYYIIGILILAGLLIGLRLRGNRK
jgi:uncharacterized GH25 family protein